MQSQDDSTDTEHEASTPRGSKTSSVSRKSNLNALTGNPSKLGKKQQLSILLSLIHDIRLVYNAALKVPRKHINVPEGGDDPEPLIKIFDEDFISRYTPEQHKKKQQEWEENSDKNSKTYEAEKELLEIIYYKILNLYAGTGDKARNHNLFNKILRYRPYPLAALSSLYAQADLAEEDEADKRMDLDQVLED